MHCAAEICPDLYSAGPLGVKKIPAWMRENPCAEISLAKSAPHCMALAPSLEGKETQSTPTAPSGLEGLPRHLLAGASRSGPSLELHLIPSHQGRGFFPCSISSHTIANQDSRAVPHSRSWQERPFASQLTVVGNDPWAMNGVLGTCGKGLSDLSPPLSFCCLLHVVLQQQPEPSA